MSKRDPAAGAAFYAGRVGQSFEHALRRIAAMPHQVDCEFDSYPGHKVCSCHVAVAKEALGE